MVFPFYRTQDVLRQSSAACKALKVLKSGVLKRLASVVHIVTASYFDVYATKESSQAKYASLVLGKTKIAIYDGTVPIAEWLESL